MRASCALAPTQATHDTAVEGDLEYVQGKHSQRISTAELRRRLASYGDVLLDVGAGDGRFARQMAAAHPDGYAIGVDLCRDNLREASRPARHTQDNALFLIADALALPDALANCATQLTINFPWGSLLTGLLEGHPGLLAGLARSARSGAQIEIRLNLEALAEACGSADSVETSAARVRGHLRASGFEFERPCLLDAVALKHCPTTWAHRLAFGRKPQAILLRGSWEGK
ncbi:MAG: class I SAM-dependent methyltransferase [Ktedonobacterales bacterium]